MLPPLDPTVLQRNPNFEVLYNDLCTRKLNPDGSTRDTRKQRVHDEIRRSLTAARTNFLSSQILLASLSTLPSHNTNLPPEFHSAVETVLAQLSGQLPDSDREMLADDTAFFLSNIATISDALSTQLAVSTNYLCTIANPANPPALDELNNTATCLQDTATRSLPLSIHLARQELTDTASKLLSTHLSLLSASIRILEQTQHGALARHTRTSAELLHSRATLLGLEAKSHMLAHPPPAEFVAALKEFKKVQGSGERSLRDREQLARRGLELYAKAGEKGMRDLARRKVWVEGEIERVEGEVRSLEEGRGMAG
ncbi:hypothetical protein IAQ61_009246 [Plenodomus lingam]|uniref:uncharacterized protein n=1 Tax=Leptosphaeria maculans TaxID=5022 RepID=UPI0033314DC7|nr:hypothetical protein IAQ61_009246 [Plenodomus lingam]